MFAHAPGTTAEVIEATAGCGRPRWAKLSPNVTDLLRKDEHFAYVSRIDFPPARSLVYSFRTTDVHFHLVMLGALFLAVPGVPWTRDGRG